MNAPILTNRIYFAPAGRYVYRMAMNPDLALQRSAMFIKSQRSRI